MKTIHMMIGIPGSGKTTYVKEFSRITGYKAVSTDIVRMQNPDVKEENIWPLVYETIKDILKIEDNVIFDATNVTEKVRNRFKQMVGIVDNDYQLIGYYLPTSPEICINRVKIRNEMPGELFIPLDVISSYGDVIYPPKYEENFLSSQVVTGLPFLLHDLVSDAYQGYALYFKCGEEVVEEYSGFANINTYEPVRANTCFRLASVSKQFIAYGILSLVQKGLLKLDNTLFEMFSCMPEYTKGITIHHMLCHTSGIVDYEDMPHTDIQVSDNDVLEYIKTTSSTYFPIGSKYQYSNTAYVLLGLIIEKVSQTNLGEYMQKEVFQDMENTVVNYQGITEINNRAYGNLLIDNRLQMHDQYWCSATIGDGGIYSNVIDLKKWLLRIRNIVDEPYSLMKQTNYANDLNIEYGYGLRVKDINGYQVIYHCGDTIGTNTIIGYIDKLDIEFVFLTNKGNVDASIFIKNLEKALKGKQE